ncbi:MAG: trimeric autotransporter adhesin [Thermoplasmata archaeon]|jgi:hypothetical protein|nr:trimeric autotransporter adhesin [Thermoplasmata archaeon]
MAFARVGHPMPVTSPASSRLCALAVAILVGLSASPWIAASARADSTSVMDGALPTAENSMSGVWDGANAYIFGGFENALIQRYTPATDTAITMSAHLPAASWGTSAVWDGAGNAYVFGGRAGGTIYNSIVRYTPATNAVTTMNAVLPTGLEWTSAVWDGAGHAYIFGGIGLSGFNSWIMRYTPATDTLTLLGSALPSNRYLTAAVWDGAGNAYVFGGADGGLSGHGGWVNEIVRFTPSTGAVTVVSTLPTPTDAISAVWDGAGHAFLFGGGSSGGDLDTILRYTPSTNTLATMTPRLPTPRETMAAVYDGSCNSYVIGGYDTGNLAQIVRYSCQTIANNPPSAPRSLAVSGGAQRETLTWQAPSTLGGSAITGYKVYRGTASGGETLVATLGNALTYADTGLANGTLYYYEVSAVNGVGESALSNEGRATTSSFAPTAPQGLSVTGGNGQLTLAWQAPASNGGSAITSYKVYASATSGGESLVAAGGCSGLGNVLTCTDAGFGNGVTRYYQVSAVNGVGESPRSAEASAMTLVHVPSAPQFLMASSGPGEGQITLHWQGPADTGGSAITTYLIYRNAGSGWSPYASVPSGTLTYVDSGLPLVGTYSYDVTATNGAGEGPASNAACARPYPVGVGVGC